METDRLARQIQFIIEIDKLKQILRRTLLIDSSRYENSAEHSWHLALMAIVLIEYAPEDVDLAHIIKMLLVHDLVEIEAGDAFCYSIQDNEDKVEREAQAAARLFGLLPEEQATQLHLLWIEFEAQETTSAKFAAVLDRLQPLLHNQQAKGKPWQDHGITRSQEFQRMRLVEQGAPILWSFVQQIIEDCVVAGYLNPDLEVDSSASTMHLVNKDKSPPRPN